MSPSARLAYATVLVALVLAPAAGAAQERPAGLHAITGTVFDSVAGRPLAGANVQVATAAQPPAATPFAAVTDAAGRYRIDGVPGGRYLIGFYHARLDTLGLQVRRAVDVPAGDDAVEVNLAVPAPRRVARAICGDDAADDSSATLIGTVFDAATGAPIAGAEVTLRWAEISISLRKGGGGGVIREPRELRARTGPEGRFALCALPGGDVLDLVATSGSDTTGVISVPLPAGTIAVRDLYLGAATIDTAAIAPEDSALAAALGTGPSRIVRRGTMQLRGIVTGPRGRRVTGARVRLVGAAGETVTDDSGKFVLRNLPGGTRTLHTRALGFFPDERAVNVLPGAAAVAIELRDVRTMLDTIRVVATRVYDKDSNGFLERRRRGFGNFFDESWMNRYQPNDLRMVLTNVSSIRFLGSGAASYVAVMSNGIGKCIPILFLDGVRMPGTVDFQDINSWIAGRELAQVEVYRKNEAPVDFTDAFGSCGSIVIWTRR